MALSFAVFISMGFAPALQGWLEWEGWERRKWKEIGIGYGVGMVMYDAGYREVQTGEKIPASMI